MQIEVRFHGLDSSEAVRDHVVRRVDFQLSRLGSVVSKVVVRVEDINGPKGGVDKRCQVTLRGTLISSAVVEELSTDALCAIDMALERASCARGRELERGRESRRLVRRGS